MCCLAVSVLGTGGLTTWWLYTYMVIDNITLDQVRKEEQFNLRTLYEVNDIISHEDHDFSYVILTVNIMNQKI